jgi:phosphatidylglycerol lysyltransferase
VECSTRPFGQDHPLVAATTPGDGGAVPAPGSHLRRLARSTLMVVVFGGMVFALDRILRSYSYADVVDGFARVTLVQVAIAIGLVAIQYALLAWREWLAVGYAGRRDLGARRTALASMIARPLSALGVATITGLGLRARIYGAWGFTTRDLGLVTAYNELTYYVGIVAMCGVVFTVSRVPWPPTVTIWLPPTQIVGVLGLVALAAYVAWCIRRGERPIRIRTVEVPVPGRFLLAAQLVLPVIDLGLSAGIVYAMLPASAGLPYLELVAVCLVANLASSASQVPAGLGVFEAVMLQFVAPTADHSVVLGALVVRRLITHLLPIGVGAVLLIGLELRRRPQHRHDWHDDTIATWLSVLTFASGVVLLVFGVEPQIRGALAPHGAPGPLLMFVVGVVMLIVARGLQHRTRRAWWAAISLLAVRGVVELAMGAHGYVMAILVAQVTILLACRRVFSERGVVLHAEVASWWAAFAMAIIGAIGVAMFADGELSQLGALKLVTAVVIASIAGGVVGYRVAQHRRALRAATRAATPTT